MKIIDNLYYDIDNIELDIISTESINYDCSEIEIALEDNSEPLYKRVLNWILNLFNKVINFFRSMYNNVSKKLSKIKNTLLNIKKSRGLSKIEIPESLAKKIKGCDKRISAAPKILDATISFAKRMATQDHSGKAGNKFNLFLLTEVDFRYLSKTRMDIVRDAKSGKDGHKTPENLKTAKDAESVLTKLANDLEKLKPSIDVCSKEFERASVHVKNIIDSKFNDSSMVDEVKEAMIKLDKNVKHSIDYCKDFIGSAANRLETVTSELNDLIESSMNGTKSEETSTESQLVQAIYDEYGLEGVTNIITNLAKEK